MKKLMTLLLGMALLSAGVAVTLHLRRQHRREPMFNRAPGPPKGIAPEFAALLAAPIPAVDPEDMRHVWPLYQGLEESTGLDTKMLAKHCSPGASVLAVSTRVMLAKALLQQGLLDKWREGDSFRPKVFDVIAKCPLEPAAEGLKFDTEAILAAIESAR